MTDSPYEYPLATAAGFTVVLRKSTRRTRTIAARLSGTHLVVSIPARFDLRRNATLLHGLIDRTLAKASARNPSESELRDRCIAVAKKYLPQAPTPTSVRWVTNQGKRWGSCTFGTGEIRISHRLKSVPAWVLDAVLLHEAIHLDVPSHGPEFRALEARYPRLAEANAYLEGYAKGLGIAAESDGPESASP